MLAERVRRVSKAFSVPGDTGPEAGPTIRAVRDAGSGRYVKPARSIVRHVLKNRSTEGCQPMILSVVRRGAPDDLAGQQDHLAD